MASQFSGQSQFSNSFARTQAGDPLRFGLVNPQRSIQRETIHPWLLQAQQNALSGAGLLGGGFGGSGSGSGSMTQGGDTSGYKELSDSLLGQLQGAGASQREDINRAFDTSLNSTLARLSDRGWGNSSLVETTQQANDRNRQSSLTELEDQLLQQRIGVQQNIGLAGLNAQQQQRNMQMSFQNQLMGGLFGGLFG